MRSDTITFLRSRTPVITVMTDTISFYEVSDRRPLDASNGLQERRRYLPTKINSEDYTSRTMEGACCFGNVQTNKYTKFSGKKTLDEVSRNKTTPSGVAK
jgi:hypothetical protein